RRLRLDVLGLGYFGHAGLVLEARLVDLERHRTVENYATVLDGQHSPHREAASVAGSFDLIDDGRLDIARAQEISMQGMGLARRVDRPLRCRQGLAQNLPAEHVTGADIATLAAEEVVLQTLEGEQIDQFGNAGLAHGAGILQKWRNYNGSGDFDGLERPGRLSGCAGRAGPAYRRCRELPAMIRSQGNSGPGSRLRGTVSASSLLAATCAVSRS